MPTLSSPLFPENALAAAAAEQFASRPSLHSVTEQLLPTLLREQFPGLEFDLPRLRLFEPLPGGSGYEHRPLIDAVLDNLARWQPLPFKDGELEGFIGYAPGTPLLLNGAALEPAKIREMVKLPTDWLLAAYQAALLDYWRATSSQGVSRLKWLASSFQQALAPASRGTGSAARLIAQVTTAAHLEQRKALFGSAAVSVALIRAQLTARQGSQVVLAPQLLLRSACEVVWCQVNGQITAYASLDDFGRAFGASHEARYRLHALSWQLYDIVEDPFKVMADVLLNQQLEAVHALPLESASVAELERKFATVTDVAARLAGNPAFVVADRLPLQAALPQWLKQAGAADYYRYRIHWQEMAIAQAQDAGRGFLDGIPDLRDYAAQQLREAMLADHPDDPGYDPYQVVLSIEETIGTVDGFGSTYVHTLLLVDAALENLTGLPKGAMTLSHSANQLIMPWLTADYVRSLVRRVDIGAAYPRLLERQMRTDAVQAQQRQARFSRHLKVQLTLLALEYKIKGEHGFTRDALKAVTRALSGVQGKAVVRPLSFLSGEGARADTVANMFLFNIPGTTNLVLYRPLFEPLLRAFADEAALFTALAAEESLANSLLTWMADDARRVYGNGGFAEPHLGIAVDDPGSLPVAGPALLGNATLAGEPLAHFYQANVDALLTLADRNATSNTEDRWRMFKEGGWLLFSIALPLVRGPAAVAGWLLQLVGSLDRDLQQLHRGNEQERAAAVVDLLFNLATVLLHGAGQVTQVPAVLPAVRLREGLPQRVPAGEARLGLLADERLRPDLMTADLAELDTALDFRWAGNRTDTNPEMLALLERLQVGPPPAVPPAIAEGASRGMYLIGGVLQVRLKRKWFHVLGLDGDFCLVSAADAEQRGPWLQRDQQGKWQLDLRARLRGGMPPKRNLSLAAKREQVAEQMFEHRDQLTRDDRAVTQLQREALPFFTRFDTLLRECNRLETDFQADRTALKLQALSRARAAAHREQLLLEPLQEQFMAALKTHVSSWKKNFILTEEAERRGVYLQGAIYLRDVATYYKGLATTHLYLQSQYYSLNKRLQLADSWFNDAYGVLVPEPADTRWPLHEVMQRAADYSLMALNEAEAAGRLLDEARANTRLAKHWEEIGDDFRAQQKRLQLPTLARTRAGYLRALTHTLLISRISDYQERVHFQRLLASSDLIASAQSQAELSINPDEFSVDERLQVLECALEVYASARSVALYVGEVYPAGPGRDHLVAFSNTLDELTASAEIELGKLLEQPQTKAPAKPSSSAGARRVIHTRRRKVLVGSVRAPAADEPNTIVDIADVFNAKLVASFREHPGDAFVGIQTVLPEPQKPAAVPAPALIGLKALRKRGRELLGMVEGRKSKQNSFVHSNHPPVDIEFPLTALAWSIEEQAGKFERHAALGELDKGLVTQLRSAAQGLKEEGRRVRLEMCRKQLPTASNLHYLWQQRQLRVSREGDRVAVLGQVDDFLDEYKVMVNGGGTWYAHFHYTAMDTPRGAYEKGHLKVEAQRRLGYRAQLAAAQNNQQRLEIHRGNLDVEDTKGWFPF